MYDHILKWNNSLGVSNKMGIVVQIPFEFWVLPNRARLLIRGYITIYIPLPLLLLSRFSRVRLYATLWTAAHQAPLSMGFSSQEYWSGLHFLLPNIPQ